MTETEPKADMIRPLLAKCLIDENGCWNYMGYLSQAGYGRYNGRSTHVISFISTYGPVPEGKEIDHICNNPACFNPQHLQALTHYDNNKRSNSVTAQNMRKTHCARGHLLEGDNVKLYQRADGLRRKCRKCHHHYKLMAWRKKNGK